MISFEPENRPKAIEIFSEIINSQESSLNSLNKNNLKGLIK